MGDLVLRNACVTRALLVQQAGEVVVPVENACQNERSVTVAAADGSIDLGVNDWRDEFALYFAGRKVVILPDNDEPGPQAPSRLRSQFNR